MRGNSGRRLVFAAGGYRWRGRTKEFKKGRANDAILMGEEREMITPQKGVKRRGRRERK